MRKRLTVAIAAAILAIGLAAPSVFAGTPGGPDSQWCWGVVTSQRATVYHDIGAHASAQSTPRLGLGNVARLFYQLGFSDGPFVWDLGTTLAQLDPLSATHCG
jgi:hypothetical protein